MSEREKVTFEEIFEQNEKRINFYLRRLGIHDPYREFYVEGIYAMWIAYKKYEPDKGPMATYFNYTIRNRLVDMLRKKTKDSQNQEEIHAKEICAIDDGNRSGELKLPMVYASGVEVADNAFWERVKSELSANQWKWVQFYIIEGASLKEIAEQEGVSVEAVKSWGKEAKKKLKQEGESLANLY